MAQLWLRGVPTTETPTRRGLSDTYGASARRPVLPPPGTARPLTPRERAELDASIARDEWAADGGDGHVLALGELEQPPALNLEWMLRGALIEAMAAVLMRPQAARSFELEESEKSSEVAE